MRTFILTSLLLGASTATACRETDPPVVGHDPTTFRLTAAMFALAGDAGAAPMPLPNSLTTQTMWLRLDPVQARRGLATLSALGSVARGEYFLDGGSVRLAFDADDTLQSRSGSCEVPRAGYASIELDGIDADGDGVVESLTGTGNGRGTVISGDVQFGFEFESTVSGVRDDAPPALVASPSSPLHPLADVAVTVGEAIEVDTLDLIDATTSTVLAPAAFTRGVNAYRGATYTRASSPLPYGASLLAVPPAGQGLDTDGNAATPATFQVIAEPALFTTQGFEGSPSVVLFGSGGGVTDNAAIPTWPTIEGTQALELRNGASALLVLESTTETELVLRVRYGSPYAEQTVQLGVRMFDGSSVDSHLLDAPTMLTWSTASSNTLSATDVVTLTVPLPSFARGHRFSVDVRNTYENQCGWLPGPPARVLVEELRLQ